MSQFLRSHISTLSKPGSSSLVFSISYTDGLKNEEEVKHVIQLASNLLVNLCANKSSLRTSGGRPGEVRVSSVSQVEQKDVQGICKDASDNPVWVESIRVPCLA